MKLVGWAVSGVFICGLFECNQIRYDKITKIKLAMEDLYNVDSN